MRPNKGVPPQAGSGHSGFAPSPKGLGHSESVPNAVHELKTWPAYFAAIVAGEKRHELRRNDRNFQVGDILRLREFEPQTQQYTGRSISAKVTYTTGDDNPCALSFFGLKEGFCILSIAAAPGIEGESPTAESGDAQ